MRFGALLCLVLCVPGLARAEASLSLVPESGTYEAGTPLTLVVSVDAAQHPLNAAEGEIRFDVRDLRVERIDTTDSIVATWATPPEAQDGVIRFSGWFGARFDGAAGTLFTITFVPLRATEGSVSFTTGTLLAADVQETNVLSHMYAARYVVRPAQILPPPPPVSPASTAETLSAATASTAPSVPETIIEPAVADIAEEVPRQAQTAASAQAAPRFWIRDEFLFAGLVFIGFVVGFGASRVVRG